MKTPFLVAAFFVLLTGCGAQQCPSGNPLNLGNCSNPVSSIVITPASPTVPAGNTIVLAATAKLTDGTLSNLITSQCLWESSDLTLATVDGNGLVTAVAVGLPQISCTAGVTSSNPLGLVGVTVVNVVAAPQITNPNSSSCTPPCALPNATNAVAYSFTFAASGGTPPYTWNNSIGSPPSGITLTGATGVLAGTHNANDTATWTVRVCDTIPNCTPFQISLTTMAAASCGTPPNYCARTDTPVVSGVLVNGGKPPAALMGLNGAGGCVTDDMNSGPAAASLLRVTDYAMVQAQLPAAVKNFTTPSSSTQRSGNSDGSIFYVTDTGGGLDFFGHTAPCTSPFKGRATADVAGVQFTGAEFSALQPLVFYSVGGTGNPARVTLNKDTQDGNASWTAAHITASTLLDPINCPGLTAYGTGTNGPYWNRYVAKGGADISADTLDHVQAFDHRYVQDVGALIIVHDSTQPAPGCRWIDVQTGRVGGSYGPTGATTGFGPIPSPVAPIVSAVAGGGLTCLHTYSVQTTYTVIGNNNNFGGETRASTITPYTISSGACASGLKTFSVLPPTANPGGGTGINLTETATGFNVYACDDTAAPGCTPTLQSNSSNPSGVLAQPVISGVVCAGPAGSTSYTFYIVAKNAGGNSIPSAGFTVNSQSSSAPNCTVSYGAVANATSYDGLVDGYVVRSGTSTTASMVINTSVGPTVNYVNQTVPIATTPTLSSLATTGPVPQTVNGAGVMIHNLRLDPSGEWIEMSVADSFEKAQGSAPKAPMQLAWHISTTALIPSASGVQVAPYLSNGAAHWTHQAGKMVTWPAGNLKAEAVVTTFNDDVNVMNAGQTFLNVANGALDTQSGDQHLSGNFNGTVTKDAYSTTNAYILPTVPYNGEIDAWNMATGAMNRFCHTWDSGQSGFNSTPRGNVSQDGTYIVFTSDMQRNGSGLQGTASVGLGSTAGATSCTLGGSGNCRYDIFVCQLK